MGFIHVKMATSSVTQNASIYITKIKVTPLNSVVLALKSQA